MKTSIRSLIANSMSPRRRLTPLAVRDWIHENSKKIIVTRPRAHDVAKSQGPNIGNCVNPAAPIVHLTDLGAVFAKKVNAPFALV
jgi:hypothetical protein